MEEILKIDLPGFKAIYKAKWSKDIDFDNLKNVKQANGVLFNDEGQILIVNVVGNWQLPGGHIETSESYEEGLKREISEEANVDVDNITPIGHLKVNEIKGDILKPEFIQVYYFGKIIKINEQKIDPAHNKIAERKFIKPEEFTDYIPWGGIGKEIINEAEKNFLGKVTGLVNQEKRDYVNLNFMNPLKEFFKFREDIDKFIDEVHRV